MKNVVIIDYGMGNLFSIKQAVQSVNGNAIVTNSPQEILKADRVILPGVGAFGHAMNQLENSGLIEPLLEFMNSERPLMGICLGMQLLFSKSYEFGETKGLGFISGEVVHLKELKKRAPHDFRIPHIGWNRILKADNRNELKIVQSFSDNAFFYFVHSYAALPSNKNDILTETIYNGVRFCSAVEKNNVVGFQFHPERSGLNGLRIYQAFLDS